MVKDHFLYSFRFTIKNKITVGNFETLLQTINDISVKNKVAYSIDNRNVGSEIQKWVTFENLSMGIFNIVITVNSENSLIAFVIKGMNTYILKLVEKANENKIVLNVPIKNYMLMDQDKMIVTMFLII